MISFIFVIFIHVCTLLYATLLLCLSPIKEFMIVKSMDSSNLEDIQTFMDESIKGCYYNLHNTTNSHVTIM